MAVVAGMAVVSAVVTMTVVATGAMTAMCGAALLVVHEHPLSRIAYIEIYLIISGAERPGYDISWWTALVKRVSCRIRPPVRHRQALPAI